MNKKKGEALRVAVLVIFTSILLAGLIYSQDPLPAGKHTLSIHAEDTLGNSQNANFDFCICTTPDTDNDGICDTPEPQCPDIQYSDNCKDVFNYDQADYDNDKTGDVCDTCPYDALPHSNPCECSITYADWSSSLPRDTQTGLPYITLSKNEKAGIFASRTEGCNNVVIPKVNIFKVDSATTIKEIPGSIIWTASTTPTQIVEDWDGKNTLGQIDCQTTSCEYFFVASSSSFPLMSKRSSNLLVFTSEPVCDKDGDGHSSVSCGGDDCDDNDKLRFPGNSEVCDGKDNDCNSATLDSSLSKTCGSGQYCAGTQTCSGSGTVWSWSACSSNTKECADRIKSCTTPSSCNGQAIIPSRCNAQGLCVSTNNEIDNNDDSGCLNRDCGTCCSCTVSGTLGVKSYNPQQSAVDCVDPQKCDGSESCVNTPSSNGFSCSATGPILPCPEDAFSCTTITCVENPNSQLNPSCIINRDDKKCSDSTQFCNEQLFSSTTTGCGGSLQCKNPDGTAKPDQTICDNGNFCDGDDFCIKGSCIDQNPLVKRNCDDGFQCTEDSCNDNLKMCTHTKQDSSCNDGLFCTGPEICAADSRTPGSTTGCLSQNPTPCANIDDSYSCSITLCDETNDVCNTKGTLDKSQCIDSDACNGEESCVADPLLVSGPNAAKGCAAGTNIDCSDGFDCTEDTCTTVSSTYSCSNDADHSLCKQGETCSPGLFSGTGCGVITPACSGKSEGAECNDGSKCNGKDVCRSQAGTLICVNTGENAVSCSSDGIACTDEKCEEPLGVCKSTPVDSRCPSDNNRCNGIEYCDAPLGCSKRDSIVCNDNIDCTVDECKPTTSSDYECIIKSLNDNLCSLNSKLAILSCNNNPDNNPFTLDSAPEFDSKCTELYGCTSISDAERVFVHTCNKAQCNAQCEKDTDCPEVQCHSLTTPNVCEADHATEKGSRLYFYPNVKNTCSNGCTCSQLSPSAVCTQSNYVGHDADKDGYDVECGDCNDNDATIFPGNTETCDRKDNNCNTQIDEGIICDCLSTDTPKSCGPSNAGTGICKSGTQSCVDNKWGECQNAVWPLTETCNGLDDDCDSTPDEELDYTQHQCDKTLGVCANKYKTCLGSSDWQTTCDATNYGSDYDGSTELRCDGKDNDCDNSIDEINDLVLPLCKKQYGVCSGVKQTCSSGRPSGEECSNEQYSLFSTDYEAVESICDDGLDNDCDNLPDLQDADCKESLIISVISPIAKIDKVYNTGSIQFKISTNQDVDSCTYSLDTAAAVSMQKINNREWSSDIFQIREGTHNIVFSCKIGTQTISRNPFEFKTDFTSPTLTIKSPKSGTTYSNPQVSIEFDSSDSTTGDSAISSKWFKINNDETIHWYASSTSIQFSLGPQTITIYSNDSAGNEKSETISFIINPSIPLITIHSPKSQYHKTQDVLINVSVNRDANDCKYSLNGQDNASMSKENETTFSVLLSSLPERSSNVMISCSDLNNVIGSIGPVNVTVDKTAPNIVLISPVEGDTTASREVEFTFVVTDSNIISSCSIFVDSSESKINQTIKTNDENKYKATLPGGSHVVYLSCQDIAGNIGLTPSINLRMPTPDNQGGGNQGGGGGGGGGGTSTCTISESELTEGVDKTLQAGTTCRLTIKSNVYSLSIEEIQSAQIKLKLSEKTLTFKPGNVKDLNIDGGNTYDLRIKLNSITGRYAELNLKKVNLPIEKKAEPARTENRTGIEANQTGTEKPVVGDPGEEIRTPLNWIVIAVTILVSMMAIAAIILTIYETQKKKLKRIEEFQGGVKNE